MESEIEVEFFNRIHCKFPYKEKQKCIMLINEAANLSSNAIFSVIEELCRIPQSDREGVNSEFLLELLTYTANKFEHPLKEIVLDTAKVMINGHELEVDESIRRMKIIKEYPSQYAALSIVYFSCDDKEGKLEPIWENILKDWNYNSN